MSRTIRIINALLIIVIVVAASMFVSVIYPFAAGEVKVYTPSSSATILNGSVLQITVPLHVFNGGYYKIENLVFKYFIYNASSIVAGGAQILPAITGNYHHNISLDIDLLRLFSDNAYLLSHSSVFEINANLTGTYAAGLISFCIHIATSYSWTAPITNITVSKNYEVEKNGTVFELSVPFTVITAPYLSGTALQSASLFMNNSLIASFNSSIPLGESYSSVMRFALNQSQYESIMNLMLKDQITVFGYTFSYEVSL